MILVEAGTGSAGADLANSSNLFTSPTGISHVGTGSGPEWALALRDRTTRDRRPLAGSEPRSPMRWRTPAVAVDGPLGREDPVAGAARTRRCRACCASRTRRSRRWRRDRHRRAGRALLGRDRARRPRRSRGVLAASADDGPGRTPVRRLLEGAGAAVAGSTPRAMAVARALAELLRMRPFEIDDADRAAYHAAASIASNFLVTLEDAAERVGATAGLPRELLVPLVRATVENWAELGPERALTGPVARGDAATVQRQRAALARAHAGAAGTVRRARRCDASAWPREPAPRRCRRDHRRVDRGSAGRARARTAGRPAGSAWCRRWARSTTATCR